jgi:glycosyltransferase involved in cell wall biosynthesis
MIHPAMGAGGPEISVVVATYNRARRLGRLLDGLRAQTLDRSRFELVIVDDGSSDETAAVLEAASREGDLDFTVISHAVNEGRAKSRQDGWRASRADLVAFTDDDCRPDPAWLEAGLAACEASRGAIVQGRTEPDPQEIGRLGPFSRTVRVVAYDAAFQTCNVFYPREVLERVGGFDVEAFGRVHGGEDSDLAWRAIKQGAAAVFDPAPLVHHAVNELGPLGKIRLCAGWSLLAYARHPELRRAHFANGVFWKRTHVWLAQAVVGLLLPRRAWPLRIALSIPWARSLYARGKLEGGGPALAPFYAACDVAEMYACVRNSAAHRTLIL